MNCPVCSENLARVRYEGFAVLHCKSCRGHLVRQRRVRGIKRRRGQSVQQLKSEVSEELRADSTSRLRCPRCRGSMHKRRNNKLSIHVDTCPECDLIWLDGGELAILQLAYQASAQGQELAEMQRRLRDMSPERRAEFEANLARLPEPENLTEAVLGAISDSHWRLG